MDQTYTAGRAMLLITDASASLSDAHDRLRHAQNDENQLREAMLQASKAARMLAQAIVWQEATQALRTR